TGPTGSTGSRSARTRAAWAWRSWRELSRRSRSMARLRAVVVIQAPGFGGRPAAGHRSTATAKASWTASSAMSMSPKRRTRVATLRPDSARKIAAMSTPAGGRARSLSGRGLVLEGTHLDRRLAGHGGPGGQRQGLVEVGGGDDPE